MGSLNLRRLSRNTLACAAAALAAGCSSLQIDVDVYKGPLTHERHIQVRQYASMAAAAKPLIREMYAKLVGDGEAKSCDDLDARVNNITNRRARFLCEVLQLYLAVKPDTDKTPATSGSGGSSNQSNSGSGPTTRQSNVDSGKTVVLNTLPTRSDRVTSRDPELGLDQLTFAVTQAMAQASGNGPGPDRATDIAVDRLSEALILFAQKLVYVANNELLFADDALLADDPAMAQQSSAIVPQEAGREQANTTRASSRTSRTVEAKAMEEKQWANTISVLQALGNTILVHANDLRRQTERDNLHTDRASSVSGGVQEAFQPDPGATVEGIISRLKRFTLVPAKKEGEAEALDVATEQQKHLVEGNKKLLKNFLDDMAPLLAAQRTLFNNVPDEFDDGMETDENPGSLVADRQAIDSRYSAANGQKGDGLTALDEWLTVQTAPGVVTNASRPSRLIAFKNFLRSEKVRLQALGIDDTGKRADAMAILQRYVTTSVEDARRTAKRHREAIASAQLPIDTRNKQEAERLALLAKQAAAADERVMREKMTKVVRAYRPKVLAEAQALTARDPATITGILLGELRKTRANPALLQAGDPTLDEIALTIGVIETFSVPKTPCHVSVLSAQCKGATTIEVLDNLIAALRAQHVQAVAAGNEAAAANLLKAVNAAYDQRTAMIYLRPASDYLRSVYASTSLQDGAEDQHRNMLVGWFKNLRGNFMRDEEVKEKLASKRELDKINWQNVNKVTLSGGGSTNYVIAKDDVGNWYVKAYGSDPEAIVKSATSLALFNAGKGVNVNLLRRVDAQRRLDEDKTLTDAQRAALEKEVGPVNPASAEALMKVRNRYAARYAQDTLMQGTALLATMKEVQVKANARIAEVTTWPGDGCTPASAEALLKPLDERHLATARDRLAQTLTEAATPAKNNAALLVQAETNIQAGLTALYLYSSDVPRTLKHGRDTLCEAAEQVAAKRIREDVRAHVVSSATARRASIERYEDALAGVLDIASEKN